MQLRFGASNAFDSIVYGNVSQGTLNYLRQQASSFNDNLTDHGRAFMNNVRDSIEFFNGNTAIDFARSVLNTVKTNKPHEYVKYLNTVSDMQNASLVMQRWVMANPTVRELYLNQQIDGYYGTYSNVHGTAVGEDHYDYRRATDGLFMFDENGYSVTEYLEDLAPGDRDLTFGEQIDIQRTWSKMDYILKLCKDDPTSPEGGSM